MHGGGYETASDERPAPGHGVIEAAAAKMQRKPRPGRTWPGLALPER